MGEKKKEAPTPPTAWLSWKKSFYCKPEPSDVHNPQSRKQLSAVRKAGSGRSGCSRSLANLKDVIHGSRRHLEGPPSCSPRSIRSSEFINPIAHEVVLSNSRCELKITGFTGGLGAGENGGGGGGSVYVGTLTPGTPGPGGKHHRCFNPSFRNSTPAGKTSPLVAEHKKRPSLDSGSDAISCHRCGELFAKWEALEFHHLAKHAVSELGEGDSSRKIVEIICRSTWLKPESGGVRIERVLKVHNMQRTLARFEDYREAVKTKASKLAKKHPRCLADGNELLRFHGTTVSCSLGVNGSSSLCAADKCGVCRIIRRGFSSKRELKDGLGLGVFTTSTSERALESVREEDPGTRRALIVCRVIAGRVHRPLENINEMTDRIWFDSVAGKVGQYSNIEELYLLNPSALLPCFVVTVVV